MDETLQRCATRANGTATAQFPRNFRKILRDQHNIQGSVPSSHVLTLTFWLLAYGNAVAGEGTGQHHAQGVEENGRYSLKGLSGIG